MMKIVALVSLVFLVVVTGCQNAGPGASLSTPSVSAPTSSPSSASNEFEEVYRQFQYYSAVVEVVWSASGQKAQIRRDDPRYAEFIRAFFYSINAPGFNRIAKAGKGGSETTVPYALGYVLTFNLLDGTKLVFNCSSENVWFETKDFIYRLPFSQDLRVFLQDLIGQPVPPALLAVPIQPSAGEFLFQAGAKFVVLKSVSLRQSILDKDYFDISSPGKTVKKSEPCLLLTGQVESQLEQDLYMTMVARGYNSAGEEVAHTLDAGPIMGVISVFLPAKGFNGFMIHLNAAPDVERIELFPSNQLYDIAPP